MEHLSLAAELAVNSYPGRGIVIGRSDDGLRAVIAYFIMGRSANSRNRVFTEKDGGIITQAADPSKLEDPSLIIYAPVRVFGNRTIVTNGDQTDTIFEAYEKGRGFAKALRTRTFEPDAPNFTPRISGVVKVSKKGKMSYKMSILRSDEGNGGSVERFFFEYPQPVPGEGVQPAADPGALGGGDEGGGQEFGLRPAAGGVGEHSGLLEGVQQGAEDGPVEVGAEPGDLFGGDADAVLPGGGGGGLGVGAQPPVGGLGLAVRGADVGEDGAEGVDGGVHVVLPGLRSDVQDQAQRGEVVLGQAGLAAEPPEQGGGQAEVGGAVGGDGGELLFGRLVGVGAVHGAAGQQGGQGEFHGEVGGRVQHGVPDRWRAEDAGPVAEPLLGGAGGGGRQCGVFGDAIGEGPRQAARRGDAEQQADAADRASVGDDGGPVAELAQRADQRRGRGQGDHSGVRGRSRTTEPWVRARSGRRRVKIP